MITFKYESYRYVSYKLSGSITIPNFINKPYTYDRKGSEIFVWKTNFQSLSDINPIGFSKICLRFQI